jgi:colanic acid biosynthesis glycosyl transferase WcaI
MRIDDVESSAPSGVLIVGLNYAPEKVGIGPYTAGVAGAFAGAGYRVEVVTAKPYYPAWATDPSFGAGWRRSDKDGVRIMRCPIYVPRHPTGVKSGSSTISASRWRRCCHRCWRQVDGRMSSSPSRRRCCRCRRLARREARACAAMGHVQDFEVEAAFATGLIARRGWLSRAMLAIEDRLLRSADLISTISPQMAAKLAAKGIDAGRVRELRNWAEDAWRPTPDGVRTYRDQWQLGDRHVALYSGNIAAKQGIGLLIDAARRLARRPDIAIVICGEGPNRAALAAAAADLTNVHLHPLQPAERMGDLLALASIHLLPQLSDAADLVLPSKLANMLGSGRPVIATAAPGTGLFEEVSGCGIATPPWRCGRAGGGDRGAGRRRSASRGVGRGGGPASGRTVAPPRAARGLRRDGRAPHRLPHSTSADRRAAGGGMSRRRIAWGVAANLYDKLLIAGRAVADGPPAGAALGPALVRQLGTAGDDPRLSGGRRSGFGGAASLRMIGLVALDKRDEAVVVLQTACQIVAIAAVMVLAGALLAIWAAPARWLPADPALPAADVRIILVLLVLYAMAVFQSMLAGAAYVSVRLAPLYAFTSAHVTLLENMLLGAAVVGGYGPLAGAAAMLTGRVAGVIGQRMLLRRREPWLRFGIGRADPAERRLLARSAIGVVTIPLSQALVLQGSVMALGAAAGPIATPAFVAARTLSRIGLQATQLLPMR